jgi:hypothetical protein
MEEQIKALKIENLKIIQNLKNEIQIQKENLVSKNNEINDLNMKATLTGD